MNFERQFCSIYTVFPKNVIFFKITLWHITSSLYRGQVCRRLWHVTSWESVLFFNICPFRLKTLFLQLTTVQRCQRCHTFNAVMKHTSSYVITTVLIKWPRCVRTQASSLFFHWSVACLLHSAGSQLRCSSASAADLPRPILACGGLVPASLPNSVIHQFNVRAVGRSGDGSSEFGFLKTKQIPCLTCAMS